MRKKTLPTYLDADPLWDPCLAAVDHAVELLSPAWADIFACSTFCGLRSTWAEAFFVGAGGGWCFATRLLSAS